MESSVTSQISPKVYSGEISKLYKGDIDFQSELFEINIFNSTLHIAPGKSISDEENDKLVYFYVYAIKDDKVVANLGVYELLTDEQRLLYDISTFENLLLFDYYYTNPSKIKEFEIKGKNNIFDYIKTHLEYIPIDKALLTYNTFALFRKDQKESIGSEHYQSIYKKIIVILSKDIKTRGLDDEKINQLRDITKNTETLKLVLAILEPFLHVQFSFIDKGESVDNYRNKTPEQKFKPKQYIIVSTDQTFVSTSKTLPDEKVDGLEEGEIEEDEEDEIEEGEVDEGRVTASDKPTLRAEETKGEIKDDSDEPPKDEPKAKVVFKSRTDSKAESKVDPKESKGLKDSAEASEKPKASKITFLGKRLPGLKSKAESKEDLKESKDSKVEASPTKTRAFGSFFLKSKEPKESKESKEPKPKAKLSKVSETSESKAESKAESKSESKSEKAKQKSKPSKESKEEPTNLEAAGIFNKNYKPETESKSKPGKPKSAPKRQSAKFVENTKP